ncbi:hypothetical protein [Rhizobium sp. Root1204]|uniref:hypothetical protein n=1 Tax=Rhizobium sp. Root1204 TaxID=1736428 RepID=UPI0007128097|nr:hypothetical protein [Rhizobium sp. Root1204]KQV35273.1 hypothetical protein ASC96_29385 [Rhizobium sp. Root1204]
MSTSVSDAVFLPEDLNILQAFLDAWCEENSVTIDDDAAQEVAVGLMNWYRQSPPHKIRSLGDADGSFELPAVLQSLLEKL